MVVQKSLITSNYNKSSKKFNMSDEDQKEIDLRAKSVIKVNLAKSVIDMYNKFR